MKLGNILVVLGILVLAVAHYMGLFVAPVEAMMGQTGRILYVHVPTAQVALLMYMIAFVAALGGLWTGRFGWDHTLEAAVEVGVVLNALLLVQGAIWAKPTWGVYWTWDPRLTTSAILLVLFAVVLLLRRVIEVPERRLSLSAIATIVAFADVPIVYFSVKWWRTLHQGFSTTGTVSKPMLMPLGLGALGMILLTLGMFSLRRRIARGHHLREAEAPDLPDAPTPLQLDEGV